MKTNFLQWRSLKTRITLIMLVIFLTGIWTLTYYTSRRLQVDLQSLLGEQQFSTVSIVAADINLEIDFRLKSLEKITSGITPNILNDTSALQAMLNERPLLYDLFNGGYFVTSINGNTIASIPISANRIGLNYMDRDYIISALKDGKSTVGKPIVGKALNTPVIPMAVPIRDIRGRVIGALAGIVDLGRPNFLDKIVSNRYGRTGGYILIAPKYRLFITDTESRRIMQPAPAPGVNPLLDRYVQGFEGSGVVVDSQGVGILSSAKQIPAANWLIVVRIPAKEAFAPIYTMQKRMVLVAIILTILAGILTWLTLRRHFFPMLDAVEKLSAQSNSTLPLATLPIARHDEVGQLIDAFNKLLETLTLREAKLVESEEYHRSILKSAIDGIWVVDTKGRILEVNEAYCQMSGYSEQQLLSMSIYDVEAEELPDRPADRVQTIIDLSAHRFDSKHRHRDGSIFDVELSVQYHSKNGGQLIAFIRDISERKIRESAHQQAAQLIQLASTHSDLRECMSVLVGSLQNWSGCEAVGIRLSNGDDFPYFETRGFPSSFVQAENLLCVYGPDGNILRDGIGNPVLECMCGNILCGRFAPDKPFFTARGSFWTNSTTALLASTSDSDRQARTRNRCNGEGYESVALIPLHAGDQIIGLIQLNDYRKDRFTNTLIELLEGMADKVALALKRRQAETALREQEQFASATIDGLSANICVIDSHGTIVITNLAWDRFAEENNAVEGSCGKGANYLDVCKNIQDDSNSNYESIVLGIKDVVEGNLPEFVLEYPCHSPEVERWFVCKANHFSISDSSFAVISHEDITDRKRAEEAVLKRIVALTQPLETGIITFDELFNLADVQRLQDEFSSATGVASLIVLPDGNPLTSPSNFTRLCSDIIRKTDKGCGNCRKSDAAIGCYNPDGPIIQPCLSGGLWDVGAAIVVGGQHIASWLIGQVRDETQTEEQMAAYAREIGVDETCFLDAFREVPAMSREKIEQIAQVLFTLARQLSTTAYQNIQQARFINERRQAEEKLQESKNKITQLLQATDQGIYGIDINGYCTFINKSGLNIIGYQFDEVIGKDMHELIHHSHSDGSLYAVEDCPIYNAKASGAGCVIDNEVLWRKDGTSFPAEYSSHPIIESGNICGAVVTFSDISERKSAEEEKAKLEVQLNQAQKMESVGRLAGGVAHDFNNLLTVILGYTNMAIMDVGPDKPIQESLEQIRIAAERSADLTRQLLAFARQQPIAPKVLDLNDTLSGMIKMLQRLIGEDIVLNWRPTANLWMVRIDPSQIDQILANVCVNARDAIKDTGLITIETQNCSIDDDYCAIWPDAVIGDYVRIAVSDTGIGIDRETMSQIFEPFFTTKELGKGTGLGLSTVYGAVKQNNGFINIYSEPGQGTTFSICLPRHQGITEQSTNNDEQQAVLCGHETILLVEDEAAILKLVLTMLRKQGYNVLTAETPGIAIRTAREYNGEIHLLITDVIMPEMNGRDLTKNLLSIYPRMKRLFMSGYTAEVIAHHGVLEEGVHFIQKPFTPQEISTKVRELLENQ